MISRMLVLAAMLVLPSDIIWDYCHQLSSLKNFGAVLGAFPRLLAFIKSEEIKEFKHHAVHSVQHTAQHLLMHFGLVQIATIFLITVLSSRLCEYCVVRTKSLNFLSLAPFLSLSAFEMFLLQLEHAVLIYFEAKPYFFHLFGDNILVHLLWIVSVVFFIVPLVVRAKVYTEHRLHYAAPILMAAVFALGCYVFNFVYFMIDRDVLHHLGSIRDRFGILHRFCDEHGLSVRFYNSNEKHYEAACTTLSFLHYRNIIIYGDLGQFTDRQIEAALLHECCSFTALGMLEALLLPTIQRFLFAFFCIFVSKRYLKKYFSIKTINHITAFLVLEECLAMGLQRYLFFPLTLLRQAIRARADDTIVRAGLGGDYAKFLLVSEVGAQVSHINPTALYRLFNLESNLFERVERLLAHK
ncbi:hypothetical protein PAPHI01_0635 [Pancytospora philotis]|nr:hypothetical protein PAPHI01_0635 [Pancytospora philotis]